MSRLPEQRSSSATRPAVCVRSADRGDHAAIRAVIRAAYGQYEPHLPAPVFDRYLADLLDLDLHEANGRLLVAEHEHRVVGYVAHYPDTALLGFTFPPGWASGRGLAAHPEARGRGVARALIAASERLARDSDSPVFAFHTAGFMGTAIELYDGLGYRRDPTYDVDLARHYGFDGHDPIPVIAYRRDLVAQEDAAMAQLFTDPPEPDEEPEAEAPLPTTFRTPARPSVPGKSPGSPAEGARSNVDPTNNHHRRTPCTTRCSPSPSPGPEQTT